MFNKNELILDRVRSITTHDLSTNKLLFRLTSLEESSLQCTAEGEEITDAIGAVITTLYRAKRATYSATNSLISMDLAAAQYGTEKVVADNNNKIIDSTYEILAIEGGKVRLSNKPYNFEDIAYIYSIENGEVGTGYKAGTEATATEFQITEDGEITVPIGLTGKIFVEYQYENENAMKITNIASEFPKACSLIIYAYFRDKCNENVVYSGKIIAPKAKLNPEQVELALTSTGKHPFEFVMMKDYCSEEGEDELFSIIVSE